MSTALANLIRLATGTAALSLTEVLQGVDYKYGFIPTERKVSTNRSASPAGTFMRNAAEIKAAAAAKKLADEQAAAQRKLLKTQQDLLKLSKAKSIFDLQKIQIEAALKGKITEEERIRLKLMQAIEDENITQIEKYTKLLDAAQKQTKTLVDTLAGITALPDIFANWNFKSVEEKLASLDTYFKNFKGSAASAFNTLGAAQKDALGGYAPFVGSTTPTIPSAGDGTSGSGMGTNGTGSQTPPGVSVTVVAPNYDAEAEARRIRDLLLQAGYRGTGSLSVI